MSTIVGPLDIFRRRAATPSPSVRRNLGHGHSPAAAEDVCGDA